MHSDDAKREADVHVMKAQLLAAMHGDAEMAMKVYALLEAAASICSDAALFREAFSEVFSRRFT